MSNVELTAVEERCLDVVIATLKGQANSPVGHPLYPSDIKWIIERVTSIFKSEAVLVPVDAPVSICGDIHGQFVDLVRLFEQHGWPPKTRYLFLGDYVDRGTRSIETICLLFALKVRHPQWLFLLRGNHETKDINRVYGFYDEVITKYDKSLYEEFNNAFNWMPVCGLVSGRILCMHGGISPEMNTLDDLRKIQRPIEKIPPEGLVTDLLWADPHKDVTGFLPNKKRGISKLFGADAVAMICNRLDVDMVARAHQPKPMGYELFAHGQLITLFTAPDYCGETNHGGVLVVEEDLGCSIKQLKSTTKSAFDRTMENLRRSLHLD